MILTALLAAATLHGTPQPVPVRQLTSDATAEGTEILRRILAESLDAAFEDKGKRGDKVTALRQDGLRMNSLVTTLWAGHETVQHSRAFHVPDVGLFFALDASLPVVTKEKTSESERSDQPIDDEWERIRLEVRGNAFRDGTPRRLRLAAPIAAEIDPAAIETVVDVVLKTVARHATRIEGLGTRDTVTVALRLSGRGRTLLHDFAPVEHGEFRFEVEPGSEPLESEPGGFLAYALASGHEVREQNLVIRIAVGDLAGFAEGSGAGGLESLRKRALVNRY